MTRRSSASTPTTCSHEVLDRPHDAPPAARARQRHRTVGHRRRPVSRRLRQLRARPSLAFRVSAAPKAGGTLKVTMPSPTVAVDPTTMYDTGSIAIAQQVAEYLIWVEQRPHAASGAGREAGRPTRRPRSGRSTCARASPSRTASRSAPTTSWRP